MKKQVVVIHGGEIFKTRKEYLAFLKKMRPNIDRYCGKKVGWKGNFRKDIGRSFEVILPILPGALNARYEEWEPVFKNIFPFFKNNVILVGHSLGGIFLAKYLSKNKFPKKIKATFLVAAPFDDKDSYYSLLDFKLPKNLNKLAKQGGQIFICQSQDDPEVPFKDLAKYKKALPAARTMVFKNRGHFDQEHFPELVKAIKKLF